MSALTNPSTDDIKDEEVEVSEPALRRRRIMPAALNPKNSGALYVLILMIVVFSVWQPSTFPTYSTFTSILSDNTVPALVALALIVPLAAGEYDLSSGYMVGAGSMTFASLLGHGSISPLVAGVVTLLICAAIGGLNGILVVNIGLNSFIATLATGSLLEALIQTLSKGLTLSAGVARTSGFAENNWHNITLPMLSPLVLIVVLWYVMQHTSTGRKLYATGLSREAAQLAGIRTRRLRFTSLIFSATVAGFAGIIITAQIGSASPDVGPPYLIPAFAAAFLGSTQLTPGLFNSWGTLLAILLLGVLNSGLSLVGVPVWVTYISTGSVLIIALGLGQLRGGRFSSSWIRRKLIDRSPPVAQSTAREPA